MSTKKTKKRKVAPVKKRVRNEPVQKKRKKKPVVPPVKKPKKKTALPKRKSTKKPAKRKSTTKKLPTLKRRKLPSLLQPKKRKRVPAAPVSKKRKGKHPLKPVARKRKGALQPTPKKRKRALQPVAKPKKPKRKRTGPTADERRRYSTRQKIERAEIAILERQLAEARARLRHDRAKTSQLRKRLEADVKKAQAEAGGLADKYAHFISIDRLPPRMIFETSYEHAVRVVKMLRFMGYDSEQAYRQVAHHTGVQPREVYTMFMYVGNGDFVASMG